MPAHMFINQKNEKEIVSRIDLQESNPGRTHPPPPGHLYRLNLTYRVADVDPRSHGSEIRVSKNKIHPRFVQNI